MALDPAEQVFHEAVDRLAKALVATSRSPDAKRSRCGPRPNTRAMQVTGCGSDEQPRRLIGTSSRLGGRVASVELHSPPQQDLVAGKLDR